MRRITMVVLVGALLLALVAGIAVAETFRCDSNPCQGETNKSDTITEQKGSNADQIYALKGGDLVKANTFGDDTDVVGGDQGNDEIRVNDGDFRDSVDCGAGENDVAIVDANMFIGESVNFSNCESVISDGGMKLVAEDPSEEVSAAVLPE